MDISKYLKEKYGSKKVDDVLGDMPEVKELIKGIEERRVAAMKYIDGSGASTTSISTGDVTPGLSFHPDGYIPGVTDIGGFTIPEFPKFPYAGMDFGGALKDYSPVVGEYTIRPVVGEYTIRPGLSVQDNYDADEIEIKWPSPRDIDPATYIDYVRQQVLQFQHMAIGDKSDSVQMAIYACLCYRGFIPTMTFNPDGHVPDEDLIATIGVEIYCYERWHHCSLPYSKVEKQYRTTLGILNVLHQLSQKLNNILFGEE